MAERGAAMRRGLSIPSFSPQAAKGGAIVSAAALLLLVFAALPYMWNAGISAELDVKQAELDLLKAKLAAREGRGGPALTAADGIGRMFLPGTTDGTTLAAFQALVNEQAAATGLSVLRMQPLEAEADGGISPYRLAVDAAGSLEQLKTFLIGIEAMLPVVMVTGFEIQPRSSEGGEAQPYPSDDLTVSLRLEAYAWKAGQ